MLTNKSRFGTYDTVRFTDVWYECDSFLADYKGCGITATIEDSEVKLLYYLLYARYGNSHINNFDITKFKYRVFSTVFMYGPTWSKKLSLQEELRNLTADQLVEGTTQIHNHSYNPSTEPSTATLTELTTINEQTASKIKRGKVESIAAVWSLLETDVTAEFLNRFAPLFISVVEPYDNLWYADIEIDDHEE